MSRSWVLGPRCRFWTTAILKAAMRKDSDVSCTHILSTMQTIPQLKGNKAALSGCFSPPIKKCDSEGNLPARGGWRGCLFKTHCLKTAYFYGYHLSEATRLVLCDISIAEERFVEHSLRVDGVLMRSTKIICVRFSPGRIWGPCCELSWGYLRSLGKPWIATGQLGTFGIGVRVPLSVFAAERPRDS